MKREVIVLGFIIIMIIPFAAVTMTADALSVPAPQIEEFSYWDTDPKLTNGFYEGVITDTTMYHEMLCRGPYVSWNDLRQSTRTYPYVVSDNLRVEKVTAYTPVYIIESESWYSHTLDVAETIGIDVKQSFSVGVGYGYGSASVAIDGGVSKSTGFKIAAGWSETASNGETKVVYLEMEFLHVYGSVTYNKPYWPAGAWYPDGVVPITYNYDAVLLDYVHFDKTHCVTYPAGYTGAIKEPYGISKPYDDGDSDTDPEYYTYMNNFYIKYSQISSVTKYFGVKLEFSAKGFKLQGSAKFEVSSSVALSIKHSFSGSLPANIASFYRVDDSWFNTNLVPGPKTGNPDDMFVPW